jgi:hypothetical protein
VTGDLFADLVPREKLFADPVLDEALVDRMTFHDEQMEQWRRDSIVLARRHWQGRFVAAYLLGVVDTRLHELKLAIRNGATLQTIKEMLNEGSIARPRP